MAKIKLFLFVIFSLILFLISIEIACRLLVPSSKLEKLDSILNILCQDQILIWRQRPNIRCIFQGVPVTTNSLGLRNAENEKIKPEIYRIICLGDSSTFGWGVPLQSTYPFLCQRNLSERNIEVINSGEIGFSTYQGLLFLKNYLLKYKPDLIVVNFLLNDIDRYRFYKTRNLSDSELLSSNDHSLFNFSGIMVKIRTFTLLKRWASLLINKNNRLSAAALKKQYNLAKVRVNLSEFRNNLEEILRICRSNNVEVILVKPPANLSLPGLSDYEKKYLNSGQNLSKMYYQLGCNSESGADFAAARDYFKKARDYQVIDCLLDAEKYQRVIEDIAVNNGISLLDIPKIFANVPDRESLFNGRYDSIHPSVLGHKLIAEGLSGIISNYLDTKERKRANFND